MTKEEYMAQKNSPSVNHFYEKLLKLKGMMKTNAGRALAEKRHAFMQTFLAQFFLECEGDS